MMAEIQDAYNRFFRPRWESAPEVVFAVVHCWRPGQNSTLTGTLAGQIVMEGSSTSACGPGCAGSSRGSSPSFRR